MEGELMRTPLHVLLKRLGPRPGFSPKIAQELIEWAAPYGADWERALTDCNAQERFMHIVREMYRHRLLSHEAVVRAALACAQTVLVNVPEDEPRPRHALYTISVWSAGGTPLSAVSSAQRDAQAAAHRYRTNYAAQAAALACSHAAYVVVARGTNSGDALARTLSSVIASRAAVLMAKNESAKQIAADEVAALQDIKTVLIPEIIQGLSNYSKVEA